MLRGERILCFAPDPWSDIWRNRHRLLSVFARENRVLYVEPRTYLRTLGSRLRAGRLRLRDALRPRVEEVRQNLFVYRDPFYLPRTRRAGLGALVDRLRDGVFRRALERLELSEPILWLVRPEAWDVPGKLGEKLLLYHVVDDYLSYPGVTERARARLDAEERSIGARADLVVVTAEHLLELKRHLNANIHHVRNAVDARTLEEGRRPGPRPAEVAGLPRPVCGYVGGITDKLDLELLESIARRQEESGRGSLVLVGPVNVGPGEAAERIARLRSSRAVRLTGPRDAWEIPAFVRSFDVCLIPYRTGDQTRSIDPLKLYEYLAFGKPVVSADIPSLGPFLEVIRTARDREGFLRALDEAAAERDEALAERRRALAAENTWEHRAEQISRAIEEALRAKGRASAGVTA
ncbi:MAG: glycosyltransferase [Planctomycetes bacterium]|nr:glycosyltransferase [Planctomycetota bacterium]